LLFAHSEPFDYGSVTIDILRLKIIKEPAPFADHLQQPSAGMMILGVDLEMLG
jgi:hypothetical protein